MLPNAREIISRSISLYKENSQLFLRYVVLLFIPSAAIAIVSGLMESAGVFGGLLYFIILIAASLAALWLSIAFVRVLATRYGGNEPKEIRDELNASTSFILPAIWVSILVALVVMGGFILIIIPGLIFTIWFAFAFYALVLDNKRGTDALRESKRLVKGRWGTTLWLLLAPGFVFAVAMLIIQGVITVPLTFVLNGMEPGTMSFILLLSLTGLLSSAVGALFAPLTTAAPTILYLELKKNGKNIKVQ